MNCELSERLSALREAAKEVRDPTCPDDTLAYLLRRAEELQPNHILEIGAGEGLTSIALLLAVEGSELTTIELDPVRANRARKNFSDFGLSHRVRLLEGDAGEVLPLLEGSFDFVFLDGPKAQYRRYLPHIKRLLAQGGVLFSDDVLLFGWVRGEPPKKRRMLVEHIREYLDLLQADPDFETEILEIGEGLAVSKKKR